MHLPYQKVFAAEDPMPCEQLIEAALGSSYPAWVALQESLQVESGAEPQWAYYRDGGWLCKARKGNKNLAWICVWEGLTTVTFYFAERHRKELASLDISRDLREQAYTNEMVGKLLPLLIEVRDSTDVAAVRTVMEMKLRVK